MTGGSITRCGHLNDVADVLTAQPADGLSPLIACVASLVGT